MKADFASESTAVFEYGVAVTAGVVHFVASLPGEVNAVDTEVAVEPALNGSEGELTATICIKLDVAGSEEVDKFGIPQFHAGDPPLAKQGVLFRAHDGAAP